jgi:hypothetical protein
METGFIDRCIRGESLPEEIDDYVDMWHEGKAGRRLELHEFLGMTWDEYCLWAVKPSMLPAIISARKKGTAPFFAQKDCLTPNSTGKFPAPAHCR